MRQTWMVNRTAAMGALVLGLLLVGEGCGPSKKRPPETNLSAVPPVVVDAFRRGYPNSVILDAYEVRGKKGPEWRIVQYTPRAEKKVTYYSPTGDKVGGW